MSEETDEIGGSGVDGWALGQFLEEQLRGAVGGMIYFVKGFPYHIQGGVWSKLALDALQVFNDLVWFQFCSLLEQLYMLGGGELDVF